MQAALDQSRVEALRERFVAQGQGHVFRFWDRLDAPGRARLTGQLATLDLEALGRAVAGVRARASARPRPLAPAPVERIATLQAEPSRCREAHALGSALLAAGRVGVLVVAGGQGTRLGFEGPKGAFPIGPVGERSLFELQAQRIRGLRERHGARIPWYVMTSAATDRETRALFAAHGHFGLPREDEFFLVQRMMPAVDFEGRLLLDAPDHVFESPDGHGGVIAALAASGALDDLEARGVSALFTWQVDNPLVRIADPVYHGLHAAAGAEVSCKVVAKRDPAEKVGHVALVDGHVEIVEYTEIDPAQRDARDARGELVLWAGAISIYVFEAAFLRRLTADGEERLPFHASAKRIPVVDEDGRVAPGARPNGWKLERFVFDCLPAASKVSVVETDRSEYAPLKNASGADSPATVRERLSGQYRAWLEEAGVEPLPAEAVVEIDHAVFDGPADFRARGITRVAQASDAIRIASGVRT